MWRQISIAHSEDTDECSQRLDDLESLEALYGEPAPTSLSKVSTSITPKYRQWIDASNFLILSTAGSGGTDASPRGDDSNVVEIVDSKTILMPDWKGNNRLDSLKNIVENGQASLLFMVGGCDNVVRVNGTAYLSLDPKTISRFSKNGVEPKCAIVVTVGEIYFQCAEALMRSKLWVSGRERNTEVPTAGQFLKEADSSFEGDAYDAGYAENSKARMW